MADLQKIQSLFVSTIALTVQNPLKVLLQRLYSFFHIGCCSKHVWSLGQVTTWQINMTLSTVITSKIPSDALLANINFVKKQFCIKFYKMLVTSPDDPSEAAMP